ncbi:hypothetical protein IV203_010336 [Nitzschia inconspicua]|uniref:DUF6824 domain-containing protein n=1 Tax=Nitzschia inconspicua TaxID=303405 RepID=A0A9K3KWQ5_9STRA|nr:hypothetical protein IV203_010336 [Nitzschia inconspicua]
MTTIHIPPVPHGTPLTNIIEPTNIDILCGRDGYVQRHIGNQSYRQLVNANKEAYITCRKTDKLKISRCIVAAVRERGGRFLEKNAADGTWFDIGDKKAVEKTSQALREGQPKLKKKMFENNSATAGSNNDSDVGPKTFEFKRTPEFEKQAIASMNTARISTGTPLDTIAASPVVDHRPTIDINCDDVLDPAARILDVLQGPPMSPGGIAVADGNTYEYTSQFTEGANMNSISEENPYMMPDTNYDLQDQHQQYVGHHPPEFDSQVYAIEPPPTAIAASQITPAWPESPIDDFHRQTTEPHDNYTHKEYQYQQQQHYSPTYDDLASDPQAQQFDFTQRPQYSQHTYYQNHHHQQQQQEHHRDRFAPPARSRSSDSVMTSSSSIGPGRIPSDWLTLSNGSNGSAITSSTRKVDRRRMFAKMKGSYTSSATRMTDGSRRSIDGMPDIHMVDSTFSLLSIGSNNNNSRMGIQHATGASAMPPTAPGLQIAASRDDFHVMPLVGSSRRSFGSRRSLTSNMMSKDDIFALGSRRSLMSGISNISGGGADAIFSDMGRKIGAEVSTRSIALSEISGIDQPDLEGLVDFELKGGEDA